MEESPLERVRREKYLRTIVRIGLLALLLIVGVIVLLPLFRGGGSHIAGPAGLTGEKAPIFAMQDDTGRRVSLSRYRGSVVLMNLWATWCPPCRAELPDLQHLYLTNASRGFVVIGVDQGESAQRARLFARSLGVGFPIWLDPDQDYGRAYAALGLPTTVIIDRQGRIVRGFDGALTAQQMRAAVEPLLFHT